MRKCYGRLFKKQKKRSQEFNMKKLGVKEMKIAQVIFDDNFIKILFSLKISL